MNATERAYAEMAVNVAKARNECIANILDATAKLGTVFITVEESDKLLDDICVKTTALRLLRANKESYYRQGVASGDLSARND